MKSIKKVLILLFFMSSAMIVSRLDLVQASNSIYIPPECPEACNEDSSGNCYVPDTRCVNQKLFDPTYNCFENKCRGTAGSAEDSDEIVTLLNAFGTKIVLRTDNPLNTVAVLINLGITTFLGFVSLYAIIYGVYVGGVKRANSIDEGEIAAANKTLVTLILGFILAWSFIFIIQFVASILGLGSLNNLELIGPDGEDPGETITIT